MTTYVILLPGDEDAWAQSPAAEKQQGYAAHDRFAGELAARGHTVVGGAELQHSRTARTLRSGVVTDGPYAETVEQLTGFYLVQSDDLDDLVDCCRILGGVEATIEIRPTVDHTAMNQEGPQS
ncbi:MAG: YciI family protein [Dermatophilaceae bacterium]